MWVHLVGARDTTTKRGDSHEPYANGRNIEDPGHTGTISQRQRRSNQSRVGVRAIRITTELQAVHRITIPIPCAYTRNARNRDHPTRMERLQAAVATLT